MVWLDTTKKRQAYDFFQQCYQGIRGRKVAQRERNRLALTDASFTYGEIDFIYFGKLLEKVKPQAGECLVDLGSGIGKAVLATALLYPQINVVGIELLTRLHELSLKQLKKFNAVNNIQFINDDILNVDFSQADILFINATCYSDELLRGILDRLNQLKKGSRVIITSKEMSNDNFQCIDNQIQLMSWGKCRCRIYLKNA